MTLEPSIIKQFPGFKKRVDWFVNNRPEIFDRNIASMSKKGVGERLLLSLVTKERLTAILSRLLDETEFLSPYGIRSLSKYHEKHPFEMNVNGVEYMVKYLPGESDSGMFGGNSNWRGPIWFPTSFLIMEALQLFYLYYGSDFKVECPTKNGERAIHYGDHSKFLSSDPYFRDYVPFFEYFDGDTGRGLGASHQCGWTALVAKWISDVGISCVRLPRTPRSSVATTASTESSEQGPKMKRMARRKSAKSLVNYTATILDLTEEEKRHHRIGGTHSGLTPQSSISSDKARHLMEEMNEEEGIHETVVPEDRHNFETKLIGKLKDKVKNMKVTDKAKDEDIDPMDPMSPLNKDVS
nr:BPK_HP1_G0043290.mRNA.1.CDS.1 [Saccharomyces cerevisiae]